MCIAHGGLVCARASLAAVCAPDREGLASAREALCAVQGIGRAGCGDVGVGCAPHGVVAPGLGYGGRVVPDDDGHERDDVEPEPVDADAQHVNDDEPSGVGAQHADGLFRPALGEPQVRRCFAEPLPQVRLNRRECRTAR